jgi:hypothetical protein
MGAIGILGTIHNDLEYRKRLGYPIEIMEQAIKDFMPDVICGEVRPEDYEEYCKDKNYDGYLGPFEYRNLIIPLCEKHGIQFVPVDWFERDLIKYSFDGEFSEVDQKEYEEQIFKIYDDIFIIAKQSQIPFNSFEFNEIVKQKHKFQEDKEPIDNIVNWITRNHIMIARIKNAIENNKGKRILCTVGAEHNYFYYKELRRLGYEVIYPLK